MTFGLKKIFDEEHDDQDMKDLRQKVEPVRKDVDPISLHTGPGHKIEKGPKILNCEDYFMCKTCCKEVSGNILSDDGDECCVGF